MPVVSVVMSTYKESEKFLRCSIESILNQTYQDFEYIIILDNPDNDLHKKIIKEYMNLDNRIKFIVNEENLGLTASLNKGIKCAQGKYICRMDADDISELDRIEKQIEYLEENDYDLIGGITQMIDEDGEIIYSISKIPTDFEKIKKIIKYNQCIAHPTWLGKKDMFTDLNGYRNIPLCEDYDLTLRALLKGYKISNFNEQVLKYRMTSQSLSRGNLLDQFLYAEYITKCYTHGNDADLELAKKYVKRRSNQRKNIKYSRANQKFNQALYLLENKRYLECFSKCIAIPFISLYYVKKIYRLVVVQIYSL